MKTMNTDIFSHSLVVCGLALICTLLWGSAFPCIKVGYRLFEIESGDTASQMLFAGYRFTLAGLLTLIIGWLGTGRITAPNRKIWKNILILGAFQTILQYFFFYIGLSHTEGSKGSIIVASSYFFAIVLAHLVYTKKRGYSGEEQLDTRKILGCFLGVTGIILVNISSQGIGSGFTLAGEGCMLLSSLAGAIASVYLKSFANKGNPFEITGWQFLLGGLVLCLIGKGMGGQVTGFTWKSSLLLFYMAVISSVAFSLWTLLLQYNPVGKVSIYGFMNPVFGVLLSGMILGENAFTLKNLTALFLVCGGIFVVNLKRNVEK